MRTRQLQALVVVAIVLARSSDGVSEDLDSPDVTVSTRSKSYEYEHEYFSIRFGGGILFDYARFVQDDESEMQMPLLHPESGIRDLRGLVSGRIIWPRLSYTMGYMLDVKINEWKFRQTGLKLKLPELSGYLFVGRTKEGISTNKLMVGYYGWFNERAAVSDAFLPILADGARWTGTAFDNKLVYNLGGYADPLSDKESFNKNDWQAVARAVWIPMLGETSVLHVAGSVRYAGANDGVLVYRSKPEAFLAQNNAVDTGEFDADTSTIVGGELYYADGPLSAGGEYYANMVSSSSAGDPFFHGGWAFAAYLFTGETHPYDKEGAFFKDVVPTKSFFAGGPGAWELALGLSYVDLDDGTITGGRFMRVTPHLNWYLNATLRLEATYGYGLLDRMGVTGGTHFFQTRIQLQVK